MSTPILDPSLPADNSPLSSGEMRGQFQAIQNNFDDLRARLIKGRSTKGVRQKESPSRLRRGNFDGCRRFSSETATDSSQKWHERFNR
jgi:hypothetical protein